MRQLVVSAHHSETVIPGKEFEVESVSPLERYQAVFEDNGVNGTFYLMDEKKDGNPIATAFVIYRQDTAPQGEGELSILWAADASKVALLYNGMAKAYFDFSTYTGTCQSEECASARFIEFHEWDESFMDHFLG
ncbi:DUF2251 domain-containing protein [Vibrio nitrifigilis]|uniref:DUF2251 domain-containing protein n=1 Tax=Vibrio nitrifigilis TaxID=2789781 RepID=A0ABS0GIX4_9VIBR|nr:DUF2251 domain-containing protein [Vibrio nitrifigilis]MBF9002292.1 DUF2251 domain-containing protein [Vibrio nitrifigilis]